MEIKSATFTKSSPNYQLSPKPDKPEYAFIGRSNVGKSSLINRLTKKNNLAKTSQTPGKTQLINHFLINESWYLVDLPGYGWAKVSKTKRAEFGPMIKDYLMLRENLFCVFVLIDSRLEAQKIDLEFTTFLGESQIPFVMIFTKADKQKDAKTLANVEAYKKVMLETWEEMPQYFISSAVTGQGCIEILRFIRGLNEQADFGKKKKK